MEREGMSLGLEVGGGRIETIHTESERRRDAIRHALDEIGLHSHGIKSYCELDLRNGIPPELQGVALDAAGKLDELAKFLREAVKAGGGNSDKVR